MCRIVQVDQRHAVVNCPCIRHAPSVVWNRTQGFLVVSLCILVVGAVRDQRRNLIIDSSRFLEEFEKNLEIVHTGFVGVLEGSDGRRDDEANKRSWRGWGKGKWDFDGGRGRHEDDLRKLEELHELVHERRRLANVKLAALTCFCVDKNKLIMANQKNSTLKFKKVQHFPETVTGKINADDPETCPRKSMKGT